MITQEQNDRLTRVGPGTPMGNLLRRYWHPVGTEAELAKEPVQRVRWFGEDLTLFRSTRGEYGLIDERCPHRLLSLEYGIPEENGLRCAYHGWLFNAKGGCLEQPFEDVAHPESCFKNEIKIKAYPVEALGGLVWAYFGPEPRPLLPRWDVLVREDFDRVIDIYTLPCNWLQCMDNSADPVHFEFLHAGYGNYLRKKEGLPPGMNPARHRKIAFDVFKYGIMKRRLLEGEPETADDWTIGHPLLFPNILAQGGVDAPNLQIRIPIDDTHTVQLVYRAQKRKPGAAPQPIAVKHSKVFDDNGKLLVNAILSHDALAWIGQGPIMDRTRENLATSDRGVMLYHKLLNEQMDLVARGVEPMAVIRDRAENEPMIDLHREHKPLSAFDSRYDNSLDLVRKHADVVAK